MRPLLAFVLIVLLWTGAFVLSIIFVLTFFGLFLLDGLADFVKKITSQLLEWSK